MGPTFRRGSKGISTTAGMIFGIHTKNHEITDERAATVLSLHSCEVLALYNVFGSPPYFEKCQGRLPTSGKKAESFEG